MDDFDMDEALQKLLEGSEVVAPDEPEYSPTYPQSIEAERRALVSSFIDHLLSLEAMRATELNIELLFSSKQTVYDEDFIASLAELMHEDIERYEILRTGRMILSGEFPYMIETSDTGDSEEPWTVSGLINPGDTLAGTIGLYNIAPELISYEDFQRIQKEDFDGIPPEPSEAPLLSIWLSLEDVVVTDAGGNQIETHAQVLVPFSFQSLVAHKLMPKYGTLPVQSVEIENQVNLLAHFNGIIFQEICNNIENDLNYNTDERKLSGEQEHAVRAAHQYELLRHMEVVDAEDTLALSTHNSVTINGEERALHSVPVLYLQPTMMRIGDVWRVVHGFLVPGDEEGTTKIVHVLPENIANIAKTER